MQAFVMEDKENLPKPFERNRGVYFICFVSELAQIGGFHLLLIFMYYRAVILFRCVRYICRVLTLYEQG